MCVAIACETRFPSKNTLKLCEEKNPDGGGIAWVENGKVRYKKGLRYRKIWKITRQIKPPALIHFRIATIGGITPLLCHPFPIDGDVSLKTEGVANKVLIHNGHWGSWKETCLRAITNRQLFFPKGPWSDSRAMAWLSAKMGHSMLELLNEKIALLTSRRKLMLFGLNQWTERNGIYYSNTSWEWSYNYGTRTYPKSSVYSSPLDSTKDRSISCPTSYEERREKSNKVISIVGGEVKEDDILTEEEEIEERARMLKEEFEKDSVEQMEINEGIWRGGKYVH